MTEEGQKKTLQSSALKIQPQSFPATNQLVYQKANQELVLPELNQVSMMFKPDQTVCQKGMENREKNK